MDYNNTWVDTYYFDIIINRVKNIKDKFIKNITYEDNNEEEILDNILDKIEEKYGKKNNKVLLKSKL